MRYICTSIVAIASLGITGTILGDIWPSPRELTASDGASADYFGSSVAIDGNTCVIGAPATNSSTGSAYVFTSDASGTWSQVAELTASDGARNDKFGSSVAIDGDTCVIGAYGVNSSTGRAYVYTPNANGTWSQVAVLNGEATGDYFAYSVSMDGDTCVISAPGSSSTGSVYVYSFDTSGNWSQSAELVPDGGTELGFGYSVDIDGDTCVVGAAGNSNSTGSAFIYTHDASIGEWIQWGPELHASNEENGNLFGCSVAIEGETCVIGASGWNKSYTGSAYIFTPSDASGTWNQVAVLNGEAAGDYFGVSVATTNSTCVIGANGTNPGTSSRTGSVYVYAPDASGMWSQVAKINGEMDYAWFGSSANIDADTCVIGAYGTNYNTGSTYLYGVNVADVGACCYDGLCFSISEDHCNTVGGTYANEPCSSDTDCAAACDHDSNNDGDVDVEDLLTLLSTFGACQ